MNPFFELMEKYLNSTHTFTTFNQIWSLFDGASVGKIILLVLAGIVIGVLTFVVLKHEWDSDKEDGLMWIKVGAVAIFCFVSTLLDSFGKAGDTANNLGDAFVSSLGFIIWYYIVIVAVHIFNIKAFGFFKAIPYTLAQWTAGTVAGCLVGKLTFKIIPIALAIFIAVKIVMAFWGMGKEDNTASRDVELDFYKDKRRPENMHSAGGDNFQVQDNVWKGDDRIFVRNEKGEEILVRKSDYDGRYIDDNGNSYYK